MKIRRAAAMAVALLLLVAAPLLSADGAPVKKPYDTIVLPQRPAVTGTFLQPWLCSGWTDAKWDEHLDMLLSAGINIVILQWTAETPNGAFTYAGFPLPAGWKTSGSGAQSDDGMLGGLLKSAEKKGVKVFVGLNTADEWWSYAFVKKDWRSLQAKAGDEVATALYALYKAKYPHAFYGWYWPWEMYANPLGFEKGWSEMMNENLATLTALDRGMPVLFSPFVSGVLPMPGAYEEGMWKKFLSETNLRPGDIFCPQDSVGAAGLTMQSDGDHLSAMKKASETKPGLLFWVNNETFTKDFKPASMDRFVSQLYVSGQYTDTHVCFAYSHYYDPGLVNASFDHAYKAYLAQGVCRTPPPPPKISASTAPDGRTVTITVVPADQNDFHIITLLRGNKVLGLDAMDQTVSSGYSYRWTGNIGHGSTAFDATVTDCWGNTSAKSRIEVMN